MRGWFLTFEGGEGGGKTSLIEEIAGKLQAEGHFVLKIREPGGTPLGEEVRNLLLHGQGSLSPYAELCLFLAARAEHIQKVILPSLEEGKIVLCDRFNDSTIAYQGIARGLGKQRVALFCEFISQGLTPHLTFFLDVPPELGLARAQKKQSHDRIEREGIEFHKKIREAFLVLSQENPRRIRRMDGTLPLRQVCDEAMGWIEKELQRV